MWTPEFEPVALGCSACVEGVKFGGFDPFNPVRSFCECAEGMRLAGLTEAMLKRAGVGDGDRTLSDS
jgi:hypothetical protein